MISPFLLSAFPPDPDALLARCSKLITDDMLKEISEADFGMDAKKHLAALRNIRDTARVPVPMDWEPREVLRLVRCSQPEDPPWEAGALAPRQHMMRAFCCAALLRADAEPENSGYRQGDNETLICLIESALHLNRGLAEAAGCFLTWRIPQLPGDDPERALLVYGLAALALLVSPAPLEPADVDALVSLVEKTEAEVEPLWSELTPRGVEKSFLYATFFTSRHDNWHALTAKLRARYPESERLVWLTMRLLSE